MQYCFRELNTLMSKSESESEDSDSISIDESSRVSWEAWLWCCMRPEAKTGTSFDSYSAEISHNRS